MATHILIVEDEATLRETLAYNLTKEGYQVRKNECTIHDFAQDHV
jgi:DNA-binding response OmpR family regulator